MMPQYHPGHSFHPLAQSMHYPSYVHPGMLQPGAMHMLGAHGAVPMAMPGASVLQQPHVASAPATIAAASGVIADGTPLAAPSAPAATDTAVAPASSTAGPGVSVEHDAGVGTGAGGATVADAVPASVPADSPLVRAQQLPVEQPPTQDLASSALPSSTTL
jgi:hypothetical protein